MRPRNRWCSAPLAPVLAACATSPLGREQLRLYPDSEVSELGAAAFQQMKQQRPLAQAPAQERYVQCVTGELAKGLDPARAPKSWEVRVFQDDTANAFALPGGKIGVHTGMLPFSRAQESEADLLGLQLMARAGFDPRQSIELWRRMQQSAQGAPPEFLSDHPADATRIAQLQAHLPEALRMYERAAASGQRAHCQP